MFDWQKFVERLKLLRLEAGYTQKEIGEILDIGAPSYQRYENGSREPKLAALYTLARLYSVSSDYLIGLTDERNPNISKKSDSDTKPLSTKLNWDNLGNVLTTDEKKRIIEALFGDQSD